MRPVLFLMSLLIAGSAFGETRTPLKMVSPSKASLVISAARGDDLGQMAMLVDGRELQAFLDSVLANKRSALSQLKSKIQKQDCEPGISPAECGEVEFTTNVQTGYGRDGWMGGYAEHTLFAGLRESGTGHIFAADYQVVITETVSARDLGKGKGLSHETADKVYEVTSIFPYPTVPKPAK